VSRAEGKTATIQLDEKYVRTIGPLAVRLISTNGVSNPLLLFVDDLPLVEANAAHERSKSKRLTAPCSVEGRASERKFDFYPIQCAKNEMISIEVIANRIGSQLDPVLRILDQDGNELVYQNDARGVGPDCAIVFRAPESSHYLLELRDAEHGGGADYFYHLRLGTFPVAMIPFPLVVPEESAQLVAFVSAMNERTLVRRVDSPASGVHSAIPTELPSRRGGLGHARVWISERNPVLETEPNDSLADATVVPESAGVNARFDFAEDVDWFAYDIRAPGKWSFIARSRQYGSPCDPMFELMDAGGRRLAGSKLTGLEPTLRFNFEKPGRYFVKVQDAAGQHGPFACYHLDAQTDPPGFGVTTEADVMRLAPGRTEKLKLTVVRHDYDGPIRLSLEDDSGFVSMENPLVESKKKEWELELRLAATTPIGHTSAIRIHARPDRGDAPKSVAVSTRPAWRNHFERVLFPDFNGCDQIWITVFAETPAPEPAAKEER